MGALDVSYLHSVYLKTELDTLCFDASISIPAADGLVTAIDDGFENKEPFAKTPARAVW